MDILFTHHQKTQRSGHDGRVSSPYIAADVKFDYLEYEDAENPYGPSDKNPIVFP
jgi:hypothetical protein